MIKKARIFLSCGQSSDEEIKIANEIKTQLTLLGFEVYIAINEQSLIGLKEDIFYRLSSSEYFLFIDFKREKIWRKQKLCRGSLFSHQELAVASFLNLPVLAFQEVGIKKLDGLLQYLHVNCLSFSDRSLLPKLVIKNVKKEIKKGIWLVNWRNQLSHFKGSPYFNDVEMVGAQLRPSRFFHISVQNLNKFKPAINCYVYLNSVINIETSERYELETSELKWKGYQFPNAIIAPGSIRQFDAFWIIHDQPEVIRFNNLTDYTGYMIAIQSSKNFELSYSIVSENFPIETIKIKVQMSSDYREISYDVIS